jgi:hypothetical protein
MAIANRLAIMINGTVTADDKIVYAKAIDVNAPSEMN